MTEAEYELWFDKYLGSIETLNKTNVDKSPLSRIPKPLNRKRWVFICTVDLLICMVISCLLSWGYEVTGFWYLNWLSNVLLSLSLGIVASLLIMTYTNTKERNVAFYSDIIPILESRYENMHKAYFDYALKIDRLYHSKKYEECYYAWHANCNTCIVILEFLQYLHTVLPFHPQSLVLTLKDIETALDDLTEVNEMISKEFSNQRTISEATTKMCCRASECGLRGLYEIQDLIQEFKCDLYGIKYGKAARTVDNYDEEI